MEVTFRYAINIKYATTFSCYLIFLFMYTSWTEEICYSCSALAPGWAESKLASRMDKKKISCEFRLLSWSCTVEKMSCVCALKLWSTLEVSAIWRTRSSRIRIVTHKCCLSGRERLMCSVMISIVHSSQHRLLWIPTWSSSSSFSWTQCK